MADNEQNQSYNEYVVPEPGSTPQEENRSSSRRFSLQAIKNVVMSPYLWVFLVLLAGSIALVLYVQDRNTDTESIRGEDFPTSTLDESGFADLAGEQAEIDSTNKTLEIQANSVFDGTMLVRSSLEVQGQLRVGEELTLNDITVAGQATLNNADISQDLNVQGNAQFDGAATVQQALSVNDNLDVTGNGAFGGSLSAGQIETGNLSFSGNLEMNGRIITSGPQTSASSGSAIGSGGTVSVNGNDTAGTVNVNTGGSPGAGTLVNISFGQGYTATPRVNITPVGAASGDLDWYVTRTSSGFAIGSASTPGAGSNYSFDYFIVE